MADAQLDLPSRDAFTSPARSSSHHTDSQPLQCCCGNFDCIYLKRNCSVLEDVEKDVYTAAKMGQALLARHQEYMADAEGERMELITRIEKLELDKKEIELENARTIEENRALLDQLEMMNNAVADSDTRIKLLETTLQTSQQTIRRLEGVANRAADMERHISALEQEQALLHNSLRLSETESRSALLRWKKAERSINDLQEELMRMESEGKAERERHIEVLSRMERQRQVERELSTAAGRLKGAAAAKTLSDDTKPASNPAVSHFVRDLLQDNANLQLGIAELREMLVASNDEMQALREQLTSHQPVLTHEDGYGNLRAELEPRVSQELHVHHHYHVAKADGPRRRKRARPSLNSTVFTPPSTVPVSPQSTGYNRFMCDYRSRESGSAPNRWSAISDQPSDFAPSSVPSSPLSNNRSSMLFDRVAMGQSIPGSPATSFDPTSPSWNASHRKRGSEISSLSLAALSFPVGPSPPSANRRKSLSVHEEESEDNLDGPTLEPSTPNHEWEEDNKELGSITEITQPTPTSRRLSFSRDDFRAPSLSSRGMGELEFSPRRVHRALSHESIISVSGLDIHTLSSRPSQLTLRQLGTSVPTAITSTSVTAHATLSRGMGTAMLRNNLSSLDVPKGRHTRGSRIASTPIRNGSPSPNGSARSSGSAGSSINILSRWVPWRWVPGTSTLTSRIEEIANEDGASTHGSGSIQSVKDAASTQASAALKTTSQESNETPKQLSRNDTKPKPKEKGVFRHPGINQPGAIPGFAEYLAFHQRRENVPHNVNPTDVDRDALVEGLAE